MKSNKCAMPEKFPPWCSPATKQKGLSKV